LGSEAHQNEFGFFDNRTTTPAFTRLTISHRHSSTEPSHHTIRSGSVSSATSRTQLNSLAFVVGACSSPGTVAAVMFDVSLLDMGRDFDEARGDL
jgi:hypothetical protein